MPSANDILDRLKQWPVLTVVILNLVVMSCGNWVLPLIDKDEPRFAEASREMLERQDFVVPRFNGEFRFDKPPLIYWCQIASYRVFGENAFAARFPSVIFTTATAVLLVLWGKRLAGNEAALWAGLFFSTCLQVLVNGRLATADMSMVFFVTAALWSGWEFTRPRCERRLGWGLVFTVSLALGFLSKGPVAWLPLLGLIAVKIIRPTEFRLSTLETIGALVAATGIVALWGVPANLATNWQYLRVGLGYHVLFRSLHVVDGHGGRGWLALLSPLFYFLAFFASFLPWSLSVPKALREWWPERESDDAGWYLLVQAAAVFFVFTLVQTKLPHYTLPAFPCLALWLAREASRGTISRTRIFIQTAAMTALALLVTTIGFTMVRPMFVSRALFEQAKSSLKPDMRFGASVYVEPSLVWEFRSIVTNHMQSLTKDNAGTFLDCANRLLLIMPTPMYQANLSRCATNATTAQVCGINVVYGKHADVTAVICEK